MDKSLHRALTEIFRLHVKELRARAGMTQRDLAAALAREWGMVSRIELGERRVDLAEAFMVFRALGADPVHETTVLMKKFAKAAKTVTS